MKTRYFLGLAIGLFSLWMVRFFKPDMHGGVQLFLGVVLAILLGFTIDWALKQVKKR